MFQNKRFNPNYTRIRVRGEGGGGGSWVAVSSGGRLGRGFDFTMQFIFGISWQQKMLKSSSFLFSSITFNPSTDKNLLKQAKYLASANKNLTFWSINNAKTH